MPKKTCERCGADVTGKLDYKTSQYRCLCKSCYYLLKKHKKLRG